MSDGDELPRELRMPSDVRQQLEKSIQRERWYFNFQGGVAIFYSCWSIMQAWRFLSDPDWTLITLAFNTGFAIYFWYNTRKSFERLKKYDELWKRWENRL